MKPPAMVSAVPTALPPNPYSLILSICQLTVDESRLEEKLLQAEK